MKKIAYKPLEQRAKFGMLLPKLWHFDIVACQNLALPNELEMLLRDQLIQTGFVRNSLVKLWVD